METDREKILAAIIRQKKEEIARIRQTLPMCANCHRIRDDNKWHPVADFLTGQFGIKFSHGICPECMKKLYPEFC